MNMKTTTFRIFSVIFFILFTSCHEESETIDYNQYFTNYLHDTYFTATLHSDDGKLFSLVFDLNETDYDMETKRLIDPSMDSAPTDRLVFRFTNQYEKIKDGDKIKFKIIAYRWGPFPDEYVNYEHRSIIRFIIQLCDQTPL